MADFGKYMSKATALSGKLNPMRHWNRDARSAQEPQDAKEVHARVSMNRLKILVTIVNRSKADFYMDHIQSFGVNMQMVFYGKGTAPVEMLSTTGLIESDRAVIFSIIGEEKLRNALDSIDEKFNTIAGGKGIAYTIPLKSVIGKSIFNFLSNNRA